MRRHRYVMGGPPWMWGGPAMWSVCCSPAWTHEASAEDEVEALEELQRDLEEAAADVADKIKRIKERRAEKADA